MKVHLYLPPERDHDAMCDRYKHIMTTIDHDSEEIEEKRIYIQYQDDFKPERELPYAKINGKIKSFDNFWEEVIGEKKLDTGEEND